MKKKYTYDMFTRHIPLWHEVLGIMAGRPRVAGLEIGCFEGRSASWLLDHILTGEGSSLTCVDVWQNTSPPFRGAEKRFDANTADYGSRVIKHKCPSLGFLCARIAAGDRECFDLIYVDGNHHAPNVLQDAVLCWELLRPGGRLIFDDYPWTAEGLPIPPRPAIDAFLSCHGNWNLLHKDYQVIVEKNNKRSPEPHGVLVECEFQQSVARSNQLAK